MRFVIDEDLPRSTGQMLLPLDHIVFDIRDHGLRGSSDETIFRFAQKHKAILLTADMGFSSIITFSLRKHYGIIVLRFPNELSNVRMNDLVGSSVKLVEKENLANTVVIFSPKGIRLRRAGA